jgi:predicted phosphoribosyltransferase
MMGGRAYRDRRDAGCQLAAKLAHHGGKPGVVVLALPRGGVPVAYEVARALNAPVDVFLVRKLGAPGQRELALGAIATGGVRLLNHEVVRSLQIGPDVIEEITARESEELRRREQMYRGDRPAPELRGKTVILVDDGLATGASMRVAVAAVRQQQPAQIVVAVPLASPETCAEFRAEVDEIVCARTPDPFFAVGFGYDDFSQTSDDEVHELLTRAQAPADASHAACRT